MLFNTAVTNYNSKELASYIASKLMISLVIPMYDVHMQLI